MRFPFSMSAKSPMNSSSVAGREIFVSHNSGRVTAHPEVTHNELLSGDRHAPHSAVSGR
jgi:hypothetical protein